MKHLLVCREFPPAPGGGIGVYARFISHLLADGGETVHVISQQWQGAEKAIEETFDGRLVIHRIPFENWTSLREHQPHPVLKSDTKRSLFASDYYRQEFSWQASRLAERLVESEGIDLIEAQEYEAPLYYFQLRRALGLGPRREPPCFVQLHSPTRFVAQHNNWDMSAPDVVMAMRLEAHIIQTADAVLCPSRYLARQAEAEFGIENIAVIPLPIGDNSMVERSADTWKNGSICYVGRLERRKGVLEWLDAAVTIAREIFSVRFDFVGDNVLGTPHYSGEEIIERRIPKELRPRFHFHGAQPRDARLSFLAHARIAVVPSRWENFPNTCVEAMCSGLPVIASREGGMTEMIRDGGTGWLAETQDSAGLAQALRRALVTSSAQLIEMGCRASEEIRALCDNQEIVDRQMEFRTRLVQHGAYRSFYVPSHATPSDNLKPFSSQGNSGLAIVVTCFDSGQALEDCMQSIEEQTHEPAAVVIAHGDISGAKALDALNRARRKGWTVVNRREGDLVAVKNQAIEIVLASGLQPLAFVFLDSKDRLRKKFVARIEAVLHRQPHVGIVSCWSRIMDAEHDIRVEPCPSLPFQLLRNEAVPFSAIRTDALLAAGKFRVEMNDGYESWDLFNGVLAAGWTAVTIPEVLGAQSSRADTPLYMASAYADAQMRCAMLARFPELIARESQHLVLLIESRQARNVSGTVSTLEDQMALVRHALRRPRTTGVRALKLVKEKTAARIQFRFSQAVAHLSSSRINQA